MQYKDSGNTNQVCDRFASRYWNQLHLVQHFGHIISKLCIFVVSSCAFRESIPTIVSGLICERISLTMVGLLKWIPPVVASMNENFSLCKRSGKIFDWIGKNRCIDKIIEGCFIVIIIGWIKIARAKWWCRHFSIASNCGGNAFVSILLNKF